MILQYIQTHTTPKKPLKKTFNKIPNNTIYTSQPKSLKNLIKNNKFNNKFDNTMYTKNKTNIKLLQNHHTIKIFFNYKAPKHYTLNLNKLIIIPPNPNKTPFDHKKLLSIINQYNKYHNKKTTKFPNITNLFNNSTLKKTNLRIQSTLNKPKILIQTYNQYHHNHLNQNINHTHFNINKITSLSIQKLQLTQKKIQLPANHLKTIPPFHFHTLKSTKHHKLIK